MLPCPPPLVQPDFNRSLSFKGLQELEPFWAVFAVRPEKPETLEFTEDADAAFRVLFFGAFAYGLGASLCFGWLMAVCVLGSRFSF